MKTNVTIVIPNWNGADFIAEALTSLQQQTLRHKVIVVDNGSTDNSVSIIRKNFPDVQLLEFADNAGFSGGVNRGIQPALDDGADFIALFNNDATADPKWLAELVSSAEAHPEAGIVTGKLVHMDKKHLDSTGEFYTIWGMPFPRGRNQEDVGQYDALQNVFGGTGGASLYRAEMFKKIGLFDEDFFVYFEDVDISFRAQLAGWKVRFQPSAVAYHRVSATSSRLGNFTRYHSMKNFFLTWQKNMPLPILVICMPLIIVQTARLFATTIIRNRSAILFLKSMFAVAKLTPKTLKKRCTIQRSRTVSLGYIWSVLSKQTPPIIKPIRKH